MTYAARSDDKCKVTTETVGSKRGKQMMVKEEACVLETILDKYSY